MFREQLDQVMAEIGYADLIANLTDEQVVETIEDKIISLDEVDVDAPYALVKAELKDMFFEKHWIHIDLLFTDATLERLYNLLREYKRGREKS